MTEVKVFRAASLENQFGIPSIFRYYRATLEIIRPCRPCTHQNAPEGLPKQTRFPFSRPNAHESRHRDEQHSLWHFTD